MPSPLRRTKTGHHDLLPAIRPHGKISFAESHHIPTYGEVLQWSFGRGSIIRRIWLAVLGHTLLAAVVVWLTLNTSFDISIPNVMIVVLGVVLGFVISYRAMSGYDRYWQGRTAWSDTIRHCRTISRLIWFHVPPRLGANMDEHATEEEMARVMREKRLALDMVEGYVVALKHHLRGEIGIYYEDLYQLIKPLHEPRQSLAEHEILHPSEHPPSPPARQLYLTSASTFIQLTPGQKYRPKVAGDGRNLPLEIVRCLSEWFSVLEVRGTVPGSSLGGLIGSLASMEDSLSTMERILTVPLPFVYASHIRSTVWVYLILLPFQLVSLFEWFAIPGVTIAAFIYLGFAASGEELEQPFGYDENDLDLDVFCREIVHADIAQLKNTPCKNAFLNASEKGCLVSDCMMPLVDIREDDSEDEGTVGEGMAVESRIEEHSQSHRI